MNYFKIRLTLLTALILCLSCSNNEESGDDLCSTVCVYTLASGETTATAATSLEGTYELTFHYPQANAPFTDGTKATFTLKNNILTVEISGKDCITIKNPIKSSPSSTEIIFKDTCRDQYSYAVSMNATGGLNEVNLGTVSGTWLGQFNDQ